ncbi:hypothetical protein Sfulv_03160 [Streptomyces fulvorobeus]|uniref:Uncharacterized protein n=1 Tax=Streptomyces fulvorobeus TaxID=284028 RepID=A0A7J0BZ11_9ACTN|nr:hypothetical protein Sfulv_03160 [Streptomyces fulvorobeus]
MPPVERDAALVGGAGDAEVPRGALRAGGPGGEGGGTRRRRQEAGQAGGSQDERPASPGAEGRCIAWSSMSVMRAPRPGPGACCGFTQDYPRRAPVSPSSSVRVRSDRPIGPDTPKDHPLID